MTPPAALIPGQPTTALPDHTQLPDEDGAIVVNFQEHPQSSILTDSLWPRLQQVRPDGQFCVGCDCGIYYHAVSPPLDGCKAPDWFCVLGVPPLLDGANRRSYVLWHELVHPLLVIEYVSGDGREERDTTPKTGKFWVYENPIAAAYYAIFEREKSALEVFQRNPSVYHAVAANANGRFPIGELKVELGLWEGTYRGCIGPWVRAWDADTGELLPIFEEVAAANGRRAEAAEALIDDTRLMLTEETERAEAERRRANEADHRADDEKRRADDEKRRADDEKRRADALADRLRALGLDPLP